MCGLEAWHSRAGLRGLRSAEARTTQTHCSGQSLRAQPRRSNQQRGPCCRYAVPSRRVVARCNPPTALHLIDQGQQGRHARAHAGVHLHACAPKPGFAPPVSASHLGVARGRRLAAPVPLLPVRLPDRVQPSDASPAAPATLCPNAPDELDKMALAQKAASSRVATRQTAVVRAGLRRPLVVRAAAQKQQVSIIGIEGEALLPSGASRAT